MSAAPPVPSSESPLRPSERSHESENVNSESSVVSNPPSASERDAVKSERSSSAVAQPQPHFAHGIDWGVAAWLIVVHLGALAAPWTFSWQGLVAMFVMYVLTGGVGICMGYHRLLSHRSFSTFPPMRWLIAWIGGLAGEGSAIHWSANHRIHHARSDKQGDPHSPREGFLWSHCFWCLQKLEPEERDAMHRRWVPDLLRDPVLRFLDRTFLLWQIVVAAGIFGLGYVMGGTPLAVSMLVWGVFLRMTIVLHATWCINSVTHVWGYKTYDNGDDSKNLWWVALLTFGEGWHNNHHAYQRAANYGHRWWEIDFTYMMISILRMLGLAWGIAPIPAKARQILANRRIK